MLFNLLCSIAIPFALGVATANFEDENNYVNYDINNKIDTSESESSSEISYPIYDDNSLSITLNANQLNNYTFENFYNAIQTMYINNDDTMPEVYIILQSNTYSPSDYINSEGFQWIYENDYFLISDDYYFLSEIEGPFVNNVNIFTDSANEYNPIKTAIQSDIQANEQSGTGYVSVLTDMISLLVGGITGIATGVGNGVQDLVSQLFLNNGALSTFGAIVCIFGGIALAVGLSRLIFNWIQSLGNR